MAGIQERKNLQPSSRISPPSLSLTWKTSREVRHTHAQHQTEQRGAECGLAHRAIEMFTHVNSRHIRANPSVWLWLAWPGSGLACGLYTATGKTA